MLKFYTSKKYKVQSPAPYRALAFALWLAGLLIVPAGISPVFAHLPSSVHFSTPPAHDFHVSVMRVDYNPETQALEVTIKLFTDDIERSLEGLGAPKLRLGSPRELPDSDSIFSDYLNNRIAFFVDDQQRSLNYLGKEVEMDNTTWCYIEITEIEQFKTIRIRNKVLMELFEDQTNLVNIFAFGEKKSLLLRGGQPEDGTDF